MSLGSPDRIPALSDVSDWCQANHMVVVAAIGNNAFGNALFPARESSFVSVAGLNADNTKASFSNWDHGCDSSAPAVGISSEFWNNSVQVWSGTSFAAPFVSGAIADCLRRVSGPQDPGALIRATFNSGDNLDKLNVPYRGSLGTLLDIQKLDSRIQLGH